MSSEKPHVFYWLKCVCHGCDAKAGELHDLGCDMEVCSICGKQLVSCPALHHQLARRKWKPRIPYIQPLRNCASCGALYPDSFEVSDTEWDKYVIPPLQPEVLCRPCYEEMKKVFPNGWAMVK